jgi:hypothetical protein
VTNVILSSTPNLPFEEWVLLRAFDPVNCRDVKCVIKINRNQNNVDRIIMSEVQNLKNENFQTFAIYKKWDVNL